MKAAVFGTLGLDSVSLPGTPAMELVGGSALYAALGSAIFSRTSVLGVAGNDYPKKVVKMLKAKGIDLSLLQTSARPSFRWSVEYSADLSVHKTTNRIFNSFAEFDPARLNGKLDEVRAVFVGKNDPETQLAIFEQTPRSAIQIMSTTANWITNSRRQLVEAMKWADVFLVRDEELGLLVGYNLSLPEMIEKIMSMGPKVVILLRGEHGLLMYGSMGNLVVPSYPLAYAVEPTGAGDAFGGALAGILANSDQLSTSSMRRALVLASLVASFVVEDYGSAALEELTYSQVMNRAEMFLAQLPNSLDIFDSKNIYK